MVCGFDSLPWHHCPTPIHRPEFSCISHVVIFWLLHPFNPFRVSTMKYKLRLYLHYHGLDDDLELVLVVLGLILFCLHCPYRNNYWSLNLLISDMTDHHLNESSVLCRAVKVSKINLLIHTAPLKVDL